MYLTSYIYSPRRLYPAFGSNLLLACWCPRKCLKEAEMLRSGIDFYNRKDLRKRFFILSSLSSALPLVFPLSFRRSSMTSSLHWRKRTNRERQTYWRAVSGDQNMQDSLSFCTYCIIETQSLIHLSWEPINQETTFSICPLASLIFLNFESGTLCLDSLSHCILQKCDCHFLRYNLSFLDVICN
jgi:hypothetical protein